MSSTTIATLISKQRKNVPQTYMKFAATIQKHARTNAQHTAQMLTGLREVGTLAHSSSDTPLPFGHHEGPSAGGGAREGFPQENGGGKKKKRRGSYSGRRRVVMFPDIPLSLMKKMKVTCGLVWYADFCVVCLAGFGCTRIILLLIWFFVMCV